MLPSEQDTKNLRDQAGYYGGLGSSTAASLLYAIDEARNNVHAALALLGFASESLRKTNPKLYTELETTLRKVVGDA